MGLPRPPGGPITNLRPTLAAAKPTREQPMAVASRQLPTADHLAPRPRLFPSFSKPVPTAGATITDDHDHRTTPHPPGRSDPRSTSSSKPASSRTDP
jgi:hypothetical protein